MYKSGEEYKNSLGMEWLLQPNYRIHKGEDKTRLESKYGH